MMSHLPSKKPTFRQLEARRKALGLGRSSHESVESLSRLVNDAEVRLQHDARAISGSFSVAFTAQPHLLTALQPLFSRHGIRRISDDTILIPPQRIEPFRRAARRRGYRLPLPPAETASLPVEPTPAVWAALALVAALADLHGWTGDLLPIDAAILTPLRDPVAAYQAETLLRSWLGDLDRATDSAAQLIPSAAERSHRPAAERAAQKHLLPVIHKAIAAATPLTLTYRDDAGRDTTRTVEPRALLSLGRRRYLLAYCRTRHAERHFRLDRIRSLTPAGSEER